METKEILKQITKLSNDIKSEEIAEGEDFRYAKEHYNRIPEFFPKEMAELLEQHDAFLAEFKAYLEQAENEKAFDIALLKYEQKNMPKTLVEFTEQMDNLLADDAVKALKYTAFVVGNIRAEQTFTQDVETSKQLEIYGLFKTQKFGLPKELKEELEPKKKPALQPQFSFDNLMTGFNNFTQGVLNTVIDPIRQTLKDAWKTHARRCHEEKDKRGVDTVQEVAQQLYIETVQGIVKEKADTINKALDSYHVGLTQKLEELSQPQNNKSKLVM